jgi:pyruvate dehydrogenase E1 component
VDRKAVVLAALQALADDGAIEARVLEAARSKYRGDAPAGAAPWLC